ncbi:hypothetical protein [Kitasatospora sp. NPDC056181]|uniref:hypothetical protein n=1 Tax=Kitasatospora sp. NPDC056181 TaxID=3345737 RepID=UPI0035DA1157
MPAQRRAGGGPQDRRTVRTPLDDYRAAKRDDSFATPAERLSRDSILVHCVCINCKARRRL